MAVGLGSISIPDTTTLRPRAAVSGRIRLALSSMAPTLLRVHAIRSALRIGILVSLDAVTLSLAWVVMQAVFERVGGVGLIASGPQFLLASGLGLAVLGCYGSGDQRRDPGAIAGGTGFSAAVTFWHVAWNVPLTLVFPVMLGVWLLVTILLISERRILDRLIRLVRPARSGVARAVVIGSSEHAARLIDHPALGETPWCHLVAFLDPEQHQDDVAGPLAHLVRTRQVDTVIVTGHLSTPVYTAVLDAATTSGCQVLALPRVPPTSTASPRLVWRDGLPVMELTRPGLLGSRLIIKRLLDVVLSGIALLLLSPLFGLIALGIRLTSKGPLLFRQSRIGQGGNTFTILKFRTMLPDSDAQRESLLAQSVYRDGRLFKIEHDPRVTRFGAILRRTSLDELPQLWNVLRGDMSLVGPRPPMPSEVTLYEAQHYARFDVKPGMTGPWQVGGRSSIHDFEEVVRLETAYIRRWSIWLDLELMLQTVPAVFRGRGAY